MKRQLDKPAMRKSLKVFMIFTPKKCLGFSLLIHDTIIFVSLCITVAIIIMVLCILIIITIIITLIMIICVIFISIMRVMPLLRVSRMPLCPLWHAQCTTFNTQNIKAEVSTQVLKNTCKHLQVPTGTHKYSHFVICPLNRQLWTFTNTCI